MTAVSRLLEVALQHYRRREWQQAEQLYLRVLEADPNQAEALRILALIACQTGRGERAIQYLRAVLQLRPAWADAHNDLGMVFVSQKRFPDAMASFGEAVRLQPDLAAAHNNLGNTLRELGRFSEAAACLQEAIRLVPGYPEAHHNLRLVLAAQSKPLEAVATFQGSGHTCQVSPSLHTDHARGQVNGTKEAAGLPDSVKAVGSYKQISTSPAHLAEAPGDVSSPQQRDDADTSWQHALHLESDYARLHYYLARVLEKQGRPGSALARYEEVMRLVPDHEETVLRIGKIRRAHGGPNGALDGSKEWQRLKRPHERIRNTVAVTNRGAERPDAVLPDHNHANGRQRRSDFADSALLDVFFGLGPGASLSGIDPPGLEALESMCQQGRPAGASYDAKT